MVWSGLFRGGWSQMGYGRFARIGGDAGRVRAIRGAGLAVMERKCKSVWGLVAQERRGVREGGDCAARGFPRAPALRGYAVVGAWSVDFGGESAARAPGRANDGQTLRGHRGGAVGEGDGPE